MNREDQIISQLLQTLRNQYSINVERDMFKGLPNNSLIYIKDTLEKLERNGIIIRVVPEGVSEDNVNQPSLMLRQTSKTADYLNGKI